MNGLFMTQSSSLHMFFDLMESMKKKAGLDKAGFYMTDSRVYEDFRKTRPEIDSCSLLREWDIVREARGVDYDIEILRRYEEELGCPYLWSALVAERRIYLGRKYAYAQDYKPQFSHKQMLDILQVALERMEKLFDEVKPDVVVIFQCMTIGEYLAYLFARRRNITVLNLRPTRIRNYIYAVESVLEPSERLKRIFESNFNGGLDPDLRKQAERCLEEIRGKDAKYEGVVPPSDRPPTALNVSGGLKKAFEKVSALVKGEWEYRFGKYRYDNSISGYIVPFIYKSFIKPTRAKIVNMLFGGGYVRSRDLAGLDYAFLPLHPEPEITVLVYSKPYMNQLEAVRLISHNLPVGMKLVVKEHPWHVGKRTISYYRKLLAIPNVVLAHPAMKSRELVENARLTTVIAGSIGFEALVLKKPVVVLGRTPYMFLPQNMVRYADRPDLLGNDIRDLLANHNHDDKALVSYIAAIMQESTPVDLYTRLLRRTGAYNPGNVTGNSMKEDEKTRQEHVDRLAEYLLNLANVLRGQDSD